MTNTRKYNALEAALIEAVIAMREELSSLEDPPAYFTFRVEADGRVLDGELEIKFIFEGNSYNQRTQGGNLVNVVSEYKRRFGWARQNDSLCLPKVYKDEPRDDE